MSQFPRGAPEPARSAGSLAPRTSRVEGLSGSQSTSRRSRPIRRSNVRRGLGFGVGVLFAALLGAGIRVGPALFADDVRVAVGAVLQPSAYPSAQPASASASPPPTAEPTWTAPPDSPRGRTVPTNPTTPVVVVPAKGPGTFVQARISGQTASNQGRLFRFDVRVEDGLRIDETKAARLIQEILNDPRSWRGSGSWRFQLVSSPAEADLHAYIATPGTTDELCAPLLTRGEVSCQNKDRVVLNAMRWVTGAPSYGKDVANYRRYLVNHEFGHALGFQHVGCRGRGLPAPVMMQQTKGLGGCKANPWPYPNG